MSSHANSNILSRAKTSVRCFAWAALGSWGSFGSAQEKSSELPSSAWGGRFQYQLRTATANTAEASYARSASGTLGLSYAPRTDWMLQTSMSGIKELNRDERWLLRSLTVAATRNLRWNDHWSGSATASYALPVAKELLKYERSLGSFGAAVGVSWISPWDGLFLSGSLDFERYVYEFSETEGGSLLTQRSLSENLALTYQRAQWSLRLAWTNISSWDFQGERYSDEYMHNETLSYRLATNWDVYAGHTTDGRTFDYGGAANNMKLYDPYRSLLFVGGSWTFL